MWCRDIFLNDKSSKSSLDETERNNCTCTHTGDICYNAAVQLSPVMYLCYIIIQQPVKLEKKIKDISPGEY
jgi:hypothetical protein